MVMNTPGVLNEAAADIAFMLLLSASRRASEANRMVRNGDWSAGHHDAGRRHAGQTLGDTRNGRHRWEVAKRGRAFGMTIHYHNRSASPDNDAKGAIYHKSADELMKVADFLSSTAR